MKIDFFPALCAFFLIFSANVFYSQNNDLNVKIFFKPDEIEKVLNGEIITRMYVKNDAARENTDQFITIPKTKYADEDFSVYEMITDEKAFLPYELKSEKEKLVFYNTLTAFSKLNGMLYFSRLAGKPQVLIKESYRIASPDSRKKAGDNIYDKIEPKITSYFMQEDNKLGKLTFKSELVNSGDNFILINTCIDKISKIMFEVSKENEYKVITYFIYDREKKGFFYNSINIMRIRKDVLLTGNNMISPLNPTTFSNRLRGATVHLAGLLGINLQNKINPWDEKYLKLLRRSKKKKLEATK